MRRQQPSTVRARAWLPQHGLPKVPALAPYAGAVAAACLAVWFGASTVGTPDLTVPSTRAELGESVAAPAPADESPPLATRGIRRPDRFQLTARASRRPSPGEPVFAGPPRPVEIATVPTGLAAVELPAVSELPPPPSDSAPQAEGTIPIPLPSRMPAPPLDSAEFAIAGSWMLAKAGLWNGSLRVGGAGGQVRFTGSAASEADRLRIERALRAAANGRPVEFRIAVRDSRSNATSDESRHVGVRERAVSGHVRTALLQHFTDAARRSFQPADSGLLAQELDRYVSGVLRDDAELMAHAHALHSALNREGLGDAGRPGDLTKLVRFHSNAVQRRAGSIQDSLSEALPVSYWSHRSARRLERSRGSLGAISRDLVKDALALDRALVAVLLGSGEPLNARSGAESVRSLLARVRFRARQLEGAARQRID